MGFLKWIKRESLSHNTGNSNEASIWKRRQSAPPLPTIFSRKSLTSAIGVNNMPLHPPTRDEAYIKALSKFNEWRRKQKFGSSPKRSLSSSPSTLNRKNKEKRNTIANSTISFGDEQRNHQNEQQDEYEIPNSSSFSSYEELHNNRDYHEYSSLSDRIYHQPASEQGDKFHRTHPLEIAPCLFSENSKKTCSIKLRNPLNLNGKKLIMINKRKSKKHNSSSTKKLSSSESSTIYENEIKLFEQKYCNRSCNNGETLSQPLSPTRVNYVYRQKGILSPPKKFYKLNSDPFSDLSFESDLPEKQESPKAEIKSPLFLYAAPNKTAESEIKGKTKKLTKSSPIRSSFPLPPPSSSENHRSAENRRTFPYFEGRSPSPERIEQSEVNSGEPNKEKPRSNPIGCYQKLVNRHGEEVEYAIPFYENRPEYQPAESMLYENGSNFRLNGNEPNTQENKNFLITDLDKTDENIKEVKIIEELNALQDWSKNITNLNEENLQVSSKGSKNSAVRTKFQSLVICEEDHLLNGDFYKDNDHCKSSNYKSPITYRHCMFRKMSVAKCTSEYCDKIIARNSLQRNLDILRKLRHPHFIILMAVCVNKEKQPESLIFEPFKCTLHQLIESKEKDILSLQNCTDFALQICEGVIYLHENGFVHSNISSHNILISMYNNCVKLSSFELTTLLEKTSNENFVQNLKSVSSKANDTTFSRELCGDYLPYLLCFRKIFSPDVYQPPEFLIEHKNHKNNFVIPTLKSDIYGITLILWEMINLRTVSESVSPLLFTSTSPMIQKLEMREKVLNFEKDRSIKFEMILEKGLHHDPNQRFNNVEEMLGFLRELKVGKQPFGSASDEMQQFENTTTKEGKQEIDEEKRQPNSYRYICSPLMNRNFDELTCDKTSTLKREPMSKCIEKVITPKELFKEPEKKEDRPANETEIKENTKMKISSESSAICNSLKIGEFTLPSTPIARNNMLRRAAWLASNTVSPVQMTSPNEFQLSRSEEKSPNSINEHGNSLVHTPPNKKFSVNIRITHTASGKEQELINNEYEEAEDSPATPLNPSNSREIALNSSNFPATPLNPPNSPATPLQSSSNNIASHIQFWNSLSADSRKKGTTSHNNIMNSASKTANRILFTAPNAIEPSPLSKSSTVANIEVIKDNISENDLSTKATNVKENHPNLNTKDISFTENSDTSAFESAQPRVTINNLSASKRSFESTWKREIQICEKMKTKCSEDLYSSSPNQQQHHSFVKETINRFENFTSPAKEIRGNCKRKRFHLKRNGLHTDNSEDYGNDDDDDEMEYVTMEEKNLPRLPNDGTQQRFNKSKSSSILLNNSNLSVSDSCINNIEKDSVSTSINGINISKLNVKLQQCMNNSSSISKGKASSSSESKSKDDLLNPNEKSQLSSPKTENSHCHQEFLITMDLKKLRRHSSDVGYFSKTSTIQDSFEKNTARNRHTICTESLGINNGGGNITIPLNSLPECLKSLGHVMFFKNSHECEKNELPKGDKVGKLICWNCGSKMFKIDDLIRNGAAAVAADTKKEEEECNNGSRRNLLQDLEESQNDGGGGGKDGEDSNNISKSLEDSATSSGAIQKNSSKSEDQITEDIYIDDDFNQGLGANMELGVKAGDLFDFDILSAEIFSAQHHQ